MEQWEVYRGKHGAPKNLAIDEYLMEKVSEEDKKIMRVYDFEKPSVILARNESFEDLKELNDDVEYTRRHTGGSVIYCDNNAVFYSIIMPSNTNEFPERLHRDFFGPKIAETLNKIGVKDEKLGVGEHFSVRIEGKTVSGNSQRKKKDAVLYHGVLAIEKWDVDRLNELIRLREIEEKSEYDFIKSLPGINEYTEEDVSKDELEEALIDNFTGKNYKRKELTDKDLSVIENLVENKYGDEGWLKTGGNREILKKNQGFCFVDWTDEWKEDIMDYGFY